MLPLPFRLTLVSLCVWAGACVAPRTTLAPEEPAVLVDAEGFALQGYDPVAYFERGEARRGERVYAARFAAATYTFESADNRAAFVLDPERYAPAFGGWCAWALAQGEGALVAVDPRSFLVQDGRVLLFYDGPFADTRERWLARDRADLLARAERNWSRILRREPVGR